MWPKNLSLKLTALGLALLLWFHVATNREYDYPIILKLTAGEMPDGFSLAEPLPNQIKVLLHGTGKELVRLLWDEGRANLLLEPWMKGAYPASADHIQVDMSADLRVKQFIEPTTFKVHVDTVIRRRAEIQFQGEYVTAAGKSLVRAPQMEPESVMLFGPRSQINLIGSVGIEPVDFDVVETSTRVQVTVFLNDAYGVVADPSSVYVKFEVADSKQRLVEGVPIQVPQGWVAEPSTVTLNVSGAEARLNELAREVYRASVSPNQPAESGTVVSVDATVPPLIEILSVTPDRVKLVRP